MKLVLVAFLLSTQALKKKSKDWSAHNQNNVSQWGDMSIYGLLFQWGPTSCGTVAYGPQI
jgi:hypothetical protein